MTQDYRSPPLRMIELDKIRLNPANPRGPRVREDDSQFDSLRSSIRLFGILVPLVVTAQDDGYLLIDGERRCHAAKSIRTIKEVPAYIIEDGIDEARFQSMMFHIHTNRQPWNAAQQCRASEPLYGELVRTHESDRRAILKAYMAETGMDSRTARNRLQFLRWPPDIKHWVYEEKKEAYWYVVEIEDKIVEPAEKNYPEYFKTVPVNDVRRFLFKKYEAGLVTAAVEVREAAVVAKSAFTDKGARRKVVRILTQLAKERDYSFHDAHEEFLSAFPEATEPSLPSPVSMLNSVRKLAGSLSSYEAAMILDGRARGQRRVELDEFKDALRTLEEAARELLEELEEA